MAKTIIGTVQRFAAPDPGGSMKLIDAVVGDGSGACVIWFNQPDRTAAHPGAPSCSGRADQYRR
jgi:hypothetical protein